MDYICGAKWHVPLQASDRATEQTLNASQVKVPDGDRVAVDGALTMWATDFSPACLGRADLPAYHARVYQKASNAPDKRGNGTEKPADADHQKIVRTHQLLVARVALVRGTSWQALLHPYWYADRRILIEEIKALHRHTPSFPNHDDCAEWLAGEYRPVFLLMVLVVLLRRE